MKTVIIYKTRLGSTKKYAEWLNEEIEADIFDYKKDRKNVDFGKYELIILMGGTYATRIPMVKYLKKKWNEIKNKKVIFINVGMAPRDDGNTKISLKQIPKDIFNNIQYYKIPGKMKEEDAGGVKKENLDPTIKYIRELK